ncbi:MAG: hypothetical protein HGA45_24040 [Chloroflexales bacterium]|nr:hypothetical protein [Chloroflexales bacterium]
MEQNEQAMHAVLEAFELPGLRVLADAEGIAALERRPGSVLRFTEALRRGLEAFLRDTQGSPEQGHDSAHDVVRGDPEGFGLGPSPSDAAITERLRTMLAGDPEARIVLLTPATTAQPEYRFLPEYGESIAEHWVFRVIIPSAWPFLQWAIVDPRGERPAYSYMFD